MKLLGRIWPKTLKFSLLIGTLERGASSEVEIMPVARKKLRRMTINQGLRPRRVSIPQSIMERRSLGQVGREKTTRSPAMVSWSSHQNYK